MKKISIVIFCCFTSFNYCFSQTVSGWGAVVTGQYNTNNYELIGTYHGWDPYGVYIAGYNNVNANWITTRRVYIGNSNLFVADFQTANIGIGTNIVPSNYILGINGNVIANSITVKIYPRADFVFKKNYRLPPLIEVETFIDQNHHLPDLPS